MSAKNIYHDAVVAALKADGWTITDDPLTITYGRRQLFVDLAVERMVIGAVRNGINISAYKALLFTSISSTVRCGFNTMGQAGLLHGSWSKLAYQKRALS
jgi:hypothetical protein